MTSIALDSAGNVGICYFDSGAQALKFRKVSGWAPVVRPTRPDAANNSATDSFDMTWLDFDPDSNASIRFYARDNNWNYSLLANGIAENGANTATLDTSALAKGEYAIEARISDDDFNMYTSGGTNTNLNIRNRTPTAPSPSSPPNRAESATLRPEFSWRNATDMDGDVLAYYVGISRDDAFGSTHLASDAVRADGSGTTAWTASADLSDNTTYYWRVRSWDGEAFSAWSAVRSFAISVNDAPSAPTPSSPDASTGDTTPTLTFANSTDPEGHAVIYTFQLCADNGCASVVKTVAQLAEGNGGSTHVDINDSLQPGTYYWRARGTDARGLDGNWSQLARLVVTSNIASAGDSGGNAAGGNGGSGSSGDSSGKGDSNPAGASSGDGSGGGSGSGAKGGCSLVFHNAPPL